MSSKVVVYEKWSHREGSTVLHNSSCPWGNSGGGGASHVPETILMGLYFLQSYRSSKRHFTIVNYHEMG